METRPASAWLLLLSLIADCLKLAQPRDFTVKDIIYLHPSTTPYPGGFKCFTCEKAPDNYECNRWAPDIYCPKETRYCYTRHKMNDNGDSVLVTKRCVPLEKCLFVGCTGPDYEGNKVCTSCCEGPICNLPLPRNTSEAIFTTTSPINRTVRHLHSLAMTLTCMIILTLLSV
ncbi:ly6/PLAUR domain-containing protein 6 isoform X1 [Callorhinchus milii]|uniref:LY6/PLAUR domain containing 6 n=1 Tax=Callorhinchus milii TaxID=7868 RepID=K4FV55_CALMI|nr:ly6/PLAUR domain-containing protein 6 precursor [Callorhinchus milii]XP_007894533.1 ly6/PLAUR domain-containing protein 6 isoform X1 [Callorhinchus milii]AFK11614.1 ly6/PLAUR domain-containing protein 6-like protein [Callorhinchus milii]|eukprot:gi/632957534/ref/XP_007894533.1/ PREDICTED: ly6/PLAUR domain-containing protein 6 [Callorhinchus milii]